MLRAALSAVVLTAALAGCVSVLPNPNIPDALITLPSDRAHAPAVPLAADVNVYPPDATRAYAGVDIAVASQQELVFLPDVRWADAAPRLLQNAVINALNLAQGSGSANVAQLSARSDYDLRWRIVDFSVGKEVAPVHAEVDAVLLDAQTRQTVARQHFKAEVTPVTKAPRDRAAALAIAAQSIADQVSAFVATSAVVKPKT